MEKDLMVGLYVIYDKLTREIGPVFQHKSEERARRQAWSLLTKVVPYDRDCFKLLRIGKVFRQGDLPFNFCVDAEGIEEIDIDIPRFEEAESQGLLSFMDEGIKEEK